MPEGLDRFSGEGIRLEKVEALHQEVRALAFGTHCRGRAAVKNPLAPVKKDAPPEDLERFALSWVGESSSNIKPGLRAV